MRRCESRPIDRNDSLKESLKDGDKKWEQAARLTRAAELAFIIELGGSDVCPVDQMEQDWRDNTSRLRVLTGAGPSV